ncbi:hypothetical protein SAMN05421752_101443 [Natronorubrum thiooxidans]|uniref:Uncharacterized protein n=2 Tax=Natronorubrum thiooxidans TaxID=308853 RepID=A0A1N7CM37_9EURY|nr:hypothetical protein SAMN05421752_101443 [Natronorubrum thiooxidans]
MSDDSIGRYIMWTRRTFVGTAACTATLVAGCLGDDNGDDDDEADDEGAGSYETRLDEMDDYELLDYTGESEVTVEVSPNRDPAFDPDPIKVDEMTNITWRWSDSSGEIYPAEIPSPCQWSGSNGGTSHSWQFPFKGKYEIGYTEPDVEEVIGTMFVVNPDD